MFPAMRDLPTAAPLCAPTVITVIRMLLLQLLQIASPALALAASARGDLTITEVQADTTAVSPAAAWVCIQAATS